MAHNWLISGDGSHRAFGNSVPLEPTRYYRLYREHEFSLTGQYGDGHCT